MYEDIGNTFGEIFSSIDYTLNMRIMKANMSNRFMTEEDLKDTIFIRRSQCHRLLMECLSHAEFSTAKGYSSTHIHLPDYVAIIIQDRRQSFREGTGARLIAFARDAHTQRLMWSHMVICISPVIKCRLAMPQVKKASTADEFCIEGPMQAFILTLSLGMIWSTVADVYAQTNEPYCESSIWIISIASPGRTIVHEHPVRHSITPEGGGQMLHNGLTSLIGTRLQAQQETRAIIQHSQGMTASAAGQWEVSFEVHLPQLIGMLPLKTLECFMLNRFVSIHASISMQNSCYGAGMGNMSMTASKQKRIDLAPTPDWVSITHLQHQFRYLYWCAIRTYML